MCDPLRNLSDDQLLTRFRELARRDHALEADLLAHLGEIDRRRLYAREGYPSLFRYCVGALNFSEAVAYLRIGVARRACELPELLAAIRAGDLHLTGARLLAPHLTTEKRPGADRRSAPKDEGRDRAAAGGPPSQARQTDARQTAAAGAARGARNRGGGPTLPGAAASSAPGCEGGDGVSAALRLSLLRLRI